MTQRGTDTHSQRATLALRVLAEKDPCFASLSLFCHHRDSEETFAPAWTDGKTVFYGNAFEDWRQAHQVAVCAHEIMHVAFGHIPRGKRLRQRFGHRYHPKLFNIVTDAIINETLKQSGYRVPREGVFLCDLLEVVLGEKVAAKDALSKWTAETLYVLIATFAEALPPLAIAFCERGDGSGESGSDTSDPDSQSDADAGSDGDADNDNDTDSDCDAESDEDAGSESETSSDGKKAEEATVLKAVYVYAASKGFQDDIDHTAATAPLTPEEEQAETEWQERTERAMTAGQTVGRGIGTLGYKLADLPKSTTPWEVILRTTVRKAVSRQRRISFSKPTRRWLAMESDAVQRGLAQPAYEPGLNPERHIPRVAVGIDVSGSISDVVLEKFAAEVVAIGKRTGAEIHVLVFDTQVLSHTQMKQGNWHEQITQVDFARGGGTDFRDMLLKAEEFHPSIIVVLTDLLGPTGDARPSAPVLWACPNANAPEPNFGKVLSLSS